jgi:hypothetical protein
LWLLMGAWVKEPAREWGRQQDLWIAQPAMVVETPAKVFLTS